MFFSLDGIDGVGKTTQMDRLCRHLEGRGHDVLRLRDPGSTQLGETLRQIVLDPQTGTISRRSEMLLYMAARAQLVEEKIVPALAAGRTVVCDRFLLANVVYQGYAGGLDVEQLWQVGHVATAGVEPDLVLLLDMPVERARARMTRELDRMEQQENEFLERLRDGFLTEARRQPERIRVINADQPAEAVEAAIAAAVGERLGEGGGGKAEGGTGRVASGSELRTSD